MNVKIKNYTMKEIKDYCKKHHFVENQGSCENCEIKDFCFWKFSKPLDKWEIEENDNEKL